MTPIRLLIIVAVLGSSPAQLSASRDRRIVELGWEHRFDADDGWLLEPWLLPGGAQDATIRFGPQGASLEVPAGKAAAWTRTVNPIWVADFPWLRVEYRGAGGTLLLSDDSTGPITPGALNPENPLASGGEARIILPAGDEVLVTDLRALFKPDRAARISLILKAADRPALLQVRSISFWAADPRLTPASTQPAAAPLGSSSRLGGDWLPVTLPREKAISADWLARAFGAASIRPAEAGLAGIPFAGSSPQQAALATGIMETESLVLPVRSQGSELALLLGSRVFGSSSPWQGGKAHPRGPITSPHELRVRLEYDDGEQRDCFPWSVLRKDFSVERTPQPYVLALDPAKTLVRISIEDRMNFGQIFLLAAAINRSPRPTFMPPEPEFVPPPESASPSPRPVNVQCDRGSLRISGAWLELEADLRAGLHVQRLKLAAHGRELLPAGAASPLVELRDAQGNPITLQLTASDVRQASGGSDIHLAWSAGESSQLRLTLEAAEAGELRLSPLLVNRSNQPWKLSVAVPRLAGVRLSPLPGDCWYLLGTRSTMLGSGPLELARDYGGDYPLQLADLYAPRAGGGLGLIVPDREMTSKRFQFQQREEGASLAVWYHDLTVPPGSELRLPAAVLVPHDGDWHQLYDRYRAQVRAASGPHAGRMRDLFWCRRDYPLGGTGYLFDAARRRYTPGALIDESTRLLGGIDMIDISGWAYHEDVGRVGAYLTNDLGGLEELRRGRDVARERGVKFGLYFEGYLIDKRAPIATKGLPDWQIITKDGKPKWWSGEMEFFACPGVEQWQTELAEMVAEVAHRSAPDAVYIDEFGFCGADKACWSPHHGHPVPSNPMREETRMLRRIRAALDRRSPRTGLYIEQVPCDAMIPLADAAFNYGMVSAVPQHPTRLPLHRYLFPEFTSVEMIGYGIRPVPVAEDNLHLCIFHGLALWLKGRAESWYSPGFRETARRAYPLLTRYSEVFRSDDCTPLLPTLAGGIYANRFATPDAAIVTVYNARFADYRGELLRVPLPAGWTVRDLWADRPASFRRDGDAAVISGRIPPRSAGVFLLAPATGAGGDRDSQ